MVTSSVKLLHFLWHGKGGRAGESVIGCHGLQIVGTEAATDRTTTGNMPHRAGQHSMADALDRKGSVSPLPDLFNKVRVLQCQIRGVELHLNRAAAARLHLRHTAADNVAAVCRVLHRHLRPAAGGESPDARVLRRHLEEFQVILSTATSVHCATGEVGI